MWNWLGTIVSLLIGLALSPYLIVKLGAEGYGVWALTFALVEYYWFFDLGFRSATVKFVAHYSATGDAAGVRAVLSTVTLYSSLVAVVILAGVFTLEAHVQSFFRIPENLRGSFAILLALMTLSWCLGLVFNVFNAALEAVQHFEYSNKAAIVSASVRAVGWALALYLGYGLIAIGIVTVFSQAAGYAINYCYFRRIFPGRTISIRLANLATLREMARFGIHTFVMTISNQLRNAGAPLLIGHFLGAAFVGFYNLPVRLLQYTVELVRRIAIVTNTKAAELAARERSEGLAELAIYTNRYSLVIFMPLAILLGTYGPQLLTLWVGPSFASHSAPVLLPLLVGCVIGVVGQASAGMLLQGMGRHQGYARAVFAEAVAGLLLAIAIIPRWGILGAAWLGAALTVLDRGLIGAWIVSRTLRLKLAKFLWSVYGPPLLAALPVLMLAMWLRAASAPGIGWIQILGVAVLIAAAYYSAALFVAVDRRHRSVVEAWLSKLRRQHASEAMAHV